MPCASPSGVAAGRGLALRALPLAAALFLLADRAPAAETGPASSWRVLALRADFPLEEPDEPTTTGRGGFDLRPQAEALAEYRYPYDTPPHDRAYFEQHLQALARYYDVVSEGRVRIEFAVFPRQAERAYTLPLRALHYGNGRTPEEVNAGWLALLRGALELAAADPDGPRLTEYNSFLVFHAGLGHETGELNDIRSVFLNPQDLREPLQIGGARIRDAWILPEAADTQGRAGLNGLLAKFFGHQLGLPGLSNFAGGLPAVGGWSLMDVGANRGGYLLDGGVLQPLFGFVPPHPMAWSKARLGWIAPLAVARDTTVALVATDRAADLPKALRIPITANEYYLVENRQQRGHRGAPPGVSAPFADEVPVWIRPEQVEFSGPGHTGVWLATDEYDAFVPGSGILIWHVDEQAIASRTEAGAINNDPLDPGIFLEEADGYRDIGNPSFERMGQIEGSTEDPFYVGGRTTFGPDARSKAGAATGISVEVLDEPADTMRVRVRFHRAAAGWPVPVPEARRLQAADLDGVTGFELLVESTAGVLVGRRQGGIGAWKVAEARLLAAGDAEGDGGAELFVARGGQVSAWREGQDQALWSVDLDGRIADGLFATRLQAVADEPVLAVAGDALVVLAARTGRVLRQEAVAGTHLTAADADGDGQAELYVGSVQGVSRLDGSGLARTEIGGSPYPLAAGDLDGDGREEVIAVEPGGEVRVASQERAVAASLADTLVAGAVLGDVDGDGCLEVVVAGRTGIYGLRSGALEQADFPLRIPGADGAARPLSEPVLADLDGDGRQESIVGTATGVYALAPGRGVLAGFPVYTDGPVTCAPVAADLSGDGELELAALAGDACAVWEPAGVGPGYAGRQADWGQAGGNAARRYAAVRRNPGPPPDGHAELMPGDRVYCFPNPVTGQDQAHLRLVLAQPARVTLQVFDPLGERVERLEAQLGSGEGELAWPAHRYASGLYLCRVEAAAVDGQRAVAVVPMAVSR